MARAQKQKKETKENNGGNLGFEAKLWTTADKLRGNMGPHPKRGEESHKSN